MNWQRVRDCIIMSMVMEVLVKLKLRSVGTSTGMIVPKEMLVRMKVGEDDVLFAVETPEGYLLTPYDPEVEKQLKLGREFMSRYRDAFRALAK
jgi:putative addiction module antidote